MYYNEHHARAAAIEGAHVEIVIEAIGRHQDAKKELFEAWINDFRSCGHWQRCEDIAADIVAFAMASGRTVDRAEARSKNLGLMARPPSWQLCLKSPDSKMQGRDRGCHRGVR